jgi:hypothetical protein
MFMELGFHNVAYEDSSVLEYDAMLLMIHEISKAIFSFETSGRELLTLLHSLTFQKTDSLSVMVAEIVFPAQQFYIYT